MEYLKLTNGKVTVIVREQSNEENAAWPFQILVKDGSKRFVDVNSFTKLEAAITEAVYVFQQKTHFLI
jgi:hypothetical protein